MRRFYSELKRFLFLPIVIFIIFTVLYVYRDPFQDFWSYKNYSWKYRFTQLGDLSTKKLMGSNIRGYNSFVMGSSRTTGVFACYLNQKINKANFFHYGCFNETIGGITNKIMFLDSMGFKLANVLLYFDTDITFSQYGSVNSSDHYIIQGKPRYETIKSHWKSFMKLDRDKLNILMNGECNEKFHPNWESDPCTNDPNHLCKTFNLENYGNNSDKWLRKNRVVIDSLKRIGQFYKRSDTQQYLSNQISTVEELMLRKIQRILKKHHAKFYIVITPLWDQKKLSARDSKLLMSIFEGRVFDYSGKNSISEDDYNYPDQKHYYPFISKQMLDDFLKR